MFDEYLNKLCVQDNELELLDNIILHEKTEMIFKRKIELENNEYSIDYVRLQSKYNYTEEDENNNYEEKRDLNDKKVYLRDVAEKNLKSNGKSASRDEIDEYVENKLNDDMYSKEIDKDVYPEAALDIIEEGDYGDFNETQSIK